MAYNMERIAFQQRAETVMQDPHDEESDTDTAVHYRH